MSKVGFSVCVCYEREHTVGDRKALYVERVLLVEKSLEGELGGDIAREEDCVLAAGAVVVGEKGVGHDYSVERLYAQAAHLYFASNLLIEGSQGPFGDAGLYGRYLQQQDGRYQNEQQAGQYTEYYVL